VDPEVARASSTCAEVEHLLGIVQPGWPAVATFPGVTSFDQASCWPGW
jgi:hypothetical protein